MARCVFILLLPVLLSLSLLADARNNLLPLRKQENNDGDDSLILQDAFKQNPLRLPSEKENEMMMEVPQLVRRPWDRDQDQLPKETHNRFSVPPRLREKESDFVSRPRERESDSIFPLRKIERESDPIFLEGEREGQGKGSRFGHPGAGCHHHHGGEMKFGHLRGYGNHLRFRPQFRLSFFFTSPVDARLHGEEAVSSSFRSFPGEFLHRDESEESEFKPRERAFDRIGEGFPERVHTRHWRDHLRFRHQFPRSSSFFPSSGDHGEEAVSSSFRSFPGKFLPRTESEESRKRAFEGIGQSFPERKHSHGQWKWEFPNGEEQKDGRHEDPAAPWTDWLRSLFPRH